MDYVALLRVGFLSSYGYLTTLVIYAILYIIRIRVLFFNTLTKILSLTWEGEKKMRQNEDVILGVVIGVVSATVMLISNANHKSAMETPKAPIRETAQTMSTAGMKTVVLLRMPNGTAQVRGSTEKLSKSAWEVNGVEVLSIVHLG